MTELYHMSGRIFVTYIYDEYQPDVLMIRLILPVTLLTIDFRFFERI